jgi:hypothetical protein
LIGPKPNKCAYQKRRKTGRKEGNVKKEVEIDILLPQVKVCLASPKAAGGKK